MNMKGYRTLITNGLAFLFSLMAFYGLDIPAADQGVITTAVLALINIVLRLDTDTPPFQKGPTKPPYKQRGFVRLPVLCVLAVCSFLLLPGCATLKQTAQPFTDCADVRNPSNQTLAACYVSVETLADQADALADAGLITKEQEMDFLLQLSDTLDFLNEARALVSTDAQTATEKLALAQRILETVANALEDAQ
ncbi:MAG: hypothetical protein R3352_05310 [Salinisphaeraceae bacterium]|nr:hypothetical protein [Salinisphaeraceae bacterium]